MEMLGIRWEDGSPPVLHVDGELDLATAGELEAAMTEALSKEPTLVLDLGGVTFVGVAGLRAILAAGRSLNGHGPLPVVNARALARLLELADLGDTAAIVLRDEG